MIKHYLSYLLLQKISREHQQSQKNLAVYKANEWKDDFGESFSYALMADAISYLASGKFISVTAFRACDSCAMTEKGKNLYSRFERSEPYISYLKEANLSQAYTHSHARELNRRYAQKGSDELLVALKKACDGFFAEL